MTRLLLLVILFPLFAVSAEQSERPFVPDDPPCRTDAGIEYEPLPSAEEGRFTFPERSETVIIHRLLGRRLMGRIALRLRPDLPVAADSVEAVVQIIDRQSGDSLTVFTGRFDKDGRLEAAFSGIYGTSAMITLRGAGSDTPLADLQLAGIMLGSTPRIMLIGDSITAGKFSDDTIGFRKVLYDKLRAAGRSFDLVGAFGNPPYEGHFQGSMKINDFYPANLTPRGRGRLDVTSAMNTYRPNFAILHVGTNDLSTEPETPVTPYTNGSGFAATQTGELGTLIHYLLRWKDSTAGTDLQAVVVCLIIPLKYEDSLCAAFNIEAARLVNDFRTGRITGRPEPVYLCDTFGRFREWPNLVENGYKALMADKLHPNTAGHQLMGETIFETLAPLLGGSLKWFTDITWYAGVGGVDHYFEHQGTAIADINADGREEIYLSRTNTRPPNPRELLFLNHGELPLDEQAEQLRIEDRGASRGTVFFDMDNDGDLDLFNGNSGERNRLYENLGDKFRDITAVAGIADFRRITTGVVAFDAENDGDLDLYAVNSREKNELYIHEGGRFALQNRGADDVTEPSIPSLSLAAADIDLDDDVDLYVVKRGAPNRLFRNDGKGWFRDEAAAAGVDLNSFSNSAVFADLDNDGDLDLLIGVTASNADPAPNAAVFENVDGIFRRRLLGLSMDGYSILAEDFDNDGDLDLLLTQEESRAVFYRNDGNWRFTLVPATGAEIHAGDVRGAAAFDLDGDGDLEIVAARADMFNVLLRNNLANGYHYLRVLAHGPAGNAVGYGTKLWLFESGCIGDGTALLGYHEVQSTSGHISQPSVIQHFGLKDRTQCDLLARFPDGSYLVLRNTAADRTINIAPPRAASLPQPARVIQEDGDGQHGTVGERLAKALAVRVTDRDGQPVSGCAVTFRVIDGEAQLLPAGGSSGRIALRPETGQLIGNAVRAFDADCADAGFVFIPPHRRGTGAVLVDHFISASSAYSIWLRLRNGGKPLTLRLQIDGGTEQIVLVPTSRDWQWLALTDRPALSSGNHQFRIELDGAVQLDQLLLCENADERPQGKGEVNDSPELTDARGIAKRFVQLGTRVGIVRVAAEVFQDGEPLPGTPVLFSLTALPGPAVSMHENGGNHQAGRPGEPLAEPFVVTVLDAFGNRVPNSAITFSVLSGGGSLTKGSVVLTDADGRAGNTLVLGRESAQQVVRTDAPLRGSPIFFYAKATALAQRVKLLSGAGQNAAVLTPLPQPIVIQVLTGDEQPVPDYEIRCTVSEEGALLSRDASLSQADTTLRLITDGRGIAQLFWRLGKRVGIQRLVIRAGLVAGSPMIVEARATTGPPVVLIKIGGDKQTGVVGRPLPQPLRVSLLDAGGNPVAGQPVIFRALQADGGFTNRAELRVSTDSSGVASTVYSLGKTAGRQIVARAEVLAAVSIGGSPADFEALALPDAAALAVKLSGDGQSAPVATVLSEPLTLKITDTFGNGFAGYAAQFITDAVGARFEGNDWVSDKNGVIEAVFRLGSRAGLQRAVAVCPGLTPPRLEFSLQSLPGDPQNLLHLSGNGQIGSVNSTLSESLRVRLTDRYGNPTPGRPVDFTVVSEKGSLDGARQKSVPTNLQGNAGARLTLGDAIGDSIYIVEATARLEGDIRQTVRFYASAHILPPAAVSPLGPTTGLVGAPRRPLKKIGVKITDATGGAVADATVEWRILEGSGNLNSLESKSVTLLTNSAGESFVVWTLGALNEPQVCTASAFYNGTALHGSPVVFRALTQLPHPSVLRVVGDTSLVARPGAAINLTVQTLDQFAEPFAGQPVTFALRKGDAQLRNAVRGAVTISSDETGMVTAELIAGTRSAEIEASSFAPDGRPLICSPIRFLIEPAKPRLIVLGGNGQSATVGSQAPLPLTVRAVDENGLSISGTSVAFWVIRGDGELLGDTLQRTDKNGIAAVGYRLGKKSGLHVICAASSSFEEAAEFRIRALPEAASQLRIAGGNRQTGTAGHSLNQKLLAQALDRFDNGVPSVTINFVTRTGSVRPVRPVTDSIGVAACEWTLGLEEGEQSLTAAAEGLGEVRFTAVALPNQAPRLHLPDSLMIDENQLLKLIVAADDAENDSITIVALNLPPAAHFEQNTQEFSWRPNYEQAGRYLPAFFAADHLGAASRRVLPIIVRNVNRPPLILEADCRPKERDLGIYRKNEPIDFHVAAIDPDGDPLHFVWRVNNRPAALGRNYRFEPQTVNGATLVEALAFDLRDTSRVSWRLHVAAAVEIAELNWSYEQFIGSILSWRIRSSTTPNPMRVERSEGRSDLFAPIGETAPEVDKYRFLDASAEAGQAYCYRILEKHKDGSLFEIGRITVITPLPAAFELYPVFPNPFNETVCLRLALPQDSAVKLAVYDLLGRRVRLLHDCRLKAGCHSFIWDGSTDDGRPCASGTYFLRAESWAGKAVRKAALVR